MFLTMIRCISLLSEKAIKGLIAGEVKPEDVDKKERDLLEKQRLAALRKAEKKAAEEKKLRKLRAAQERKQWGFVGR
jgi:hypothetical protein